MYVCAHVCVFCYRRLAPRKVRTTHARAAIKTHPILTTPLPPQPANTEAHKTTAQTRHNHIQSKPLSHSNRSPYNKGTRMTMVVVTMAVKMELVIGVVCQQLVG